MAQLTQKEFNYAVALLAQNMGLQRLRDRLVNIHALTTRRGVNSAEQLADQLYLLTGALRRQVSATFGFYALWNECLHAKLGEEGEQQLEKLAEAVNACLGERDVIIEEKSAELDAALKVYEEALAEKTGSELAWMDMMLKAVPGVAERLRSKSPIGAAE